MPTEQKTSLGLNRWQGTDKPARSDFVADNETLDALLTEHFGDTQAHLSAEDRLLLGNGTEVGSYNANGGQAVTTHCRLLQKRHWFFRWIYRLPSIVQGIIG